MKSSLFAVALLLGALSGCTQATSPDALASHPTAESKGADSFVTTRGVQFYRRNKPYYFAGTNLWYGANLAATETGRSRLVRELDLMKELGVTNLRILGASEGPGQHNSVTPQFKPSRDRINDELFQGLDFVLAEMSKRDMTAVIYLNNYWIWSGGMSQYVSWLTGKPVPNPFVEGNTWDEFMEFSAEFYSSPQAQKLYRDYISALVNRTNAVTGLRYKDDPTILSWQLANEPRPGSGRTAAQNMPTFLGWVSDTADFIKSIDPHHLVSIGTEGLHGCNHIESCYTQAALSKSIDYLNMHIWILNWGWFDPKNMEATYSDSLEKAAEYMNQHAALAAQLGKPVTLEEFGAPRDAADISDQSTTVYRDKYFKAMFAKIYQNASQGGPIAGSNFWAWGGEGRARNPEEGVWQPGDDLVGDPPQEPQGLNSVFSSDKSTLDIIAAHGRKMAELGVKSTP